MIELQVVQGSMEWHEVRAGSDCASEAASALGLSDKCSRSELMRIKHTGLTPDVSEWVQKFLFDKGHEIEALARPIVEKRLGESLFPITALSDDKKFHFVLPGGTLLSACLHLARSHTRTCERRLWTLNRSYPIDISILKYMNRLSDYFFALALCMK